MNEPQTTPLRALILLTDAFLSRHGSFPLDNATPEQRQWHQAMTVAYSLVGPPGSMMRTQALRAAINDASTWTYLATCIEMHAEKFPVPDHMRAYAKKLREVGLEGAGVRELATHLSDIVTHGPGYVASPPPLVESKPQPTTGPLFRVILSDNFGREGPGYDEQWICAHALRMEAAEALARELNIQHATSGGDFWAAVVPADYTLYKFEP